MANKIDQLQFFNILESQKRILVSEHLYPESGINNICSSFYLESPGQPDLLGQAIHHVLANSQAINLRFSLDQGRLRQYYHPYHPLAGELLDFTDQSGQLRQEAWLRETAHTHLAYIDSPLFYWALYYSAQGKLAFLLKTHHAVSDAWTHQLLATRIVAAYRSLLAGLDPPAIEEAPFLGQLAEESNYLNSAQCQGNRDFWRKELFPLPDSLGIAHGNGPASARAERFQLQFSPGESRDIDAFLAKAGIGPSQFFLNALVILLFRMYRHPDFLIAVMTHNRIGKREKSMTGMFVNTLPLRVRLNGGETVAELSDSLSLAMTALLRNQRLPFGLFRDLDPSAAQLFPTMEVAYNYDKVEPNIECTQNFIQAEVFPLMVRASRRNSDKPYEMELDYRLDSFSDDSVANFADCLRRIIQQMLDGTTKPISQLQWLSDDIQVKVLRQFNDTAYPNPYETTLPAIFEAMVRQRPMAMAVSDEHQALSYAELNRQANQFARLLQTYAIDREQAIAVLLQRSVRMMVALLGILKSGHPYLPLSPDQPHKRLELMLADSQCRLLVSEGDVAQGLSWDGTVLDIAAADTGALSGEDLGITVDPHSLAYILYTSGSTGKPKGVMLEQRSVVNRLYWLRRRYPLLESDIILQKTPYTFDVSVWELFGWFFAGGRLYFLRPGGEKEPETIVQAIQSRAITTIHFVPSMLAVFLEYLEQGGGLQALASLKTVSCSGEALQAKQVAAFRRLIGERFGAKLYNLYGPTEAAIDVTFHDCSQDQSEQVSIGRPIDNAEILILDAYGQLVPPAVPGELHIGGVCLARGYFGRPDLTAEKFIPHPFQDGERLYKSGDLASWNGDGSIRYLGRIDFQVKIRGNRVEIGEIEAALLRLPEIREAVVVALPDQNGQTYLGAYFVADRPIDHQSIRHFLKIELPVYMIPTFFTQMSQFPLNASGKLDRKALPPPNSGNLTGRSFVAPRTECEEKIAGIWEEVLRCEGIGIHDNFFDVGGDSLSLIQVHGRLQQDYPLSLQELFDFPTIASLAEQCLSRQAKETAPPIQICHDTKCEMQSQLAKIWDYQQGLLRARGQTPAALLATASILLTGATGYIGAHLTRELLANTDARLILLVRAASQTEAELRFAARYAAYFGTADLPSLRHRIQVVNGDLTQPQFGLSADAWRDLSNRCELVIHAAADVRHYGLASEFQSVNVAGTQRVMEFCQIGQTKTLHYLSTVSIALAQAHPTVLRVFCEQDSAKGLSSQNVYLQSKIESEILLQEQYPQVRIHRLGNVSVDYHSGQFQLNAAANAFAQSLRRYREIGAMPNIATRFLDFSFVDQCAKALRHLMLDPACDPGVYHVINPIRYSLVDLAQLAGLELVDAPSFLDRVARDDQIRIHAPYLDHPELLNVFIYSDKTVDILKNSGFSWEQLNHAHIKSLFDQVESAELPVQQSDIRCVTKDSL